MSEGADRLKLVTLGQEPMASQIAASDLAQVAWITRTTADGTRDLLRWSLPRLPEGLDRRFPRDDDPGVFLVAEGLEAFGVRFLDAEGAWVDRWDSSALVQSSQLPQVAEISVTLAGDPPAGPYRRRVVLPMRPIDLAARLSGEEAAGGEDEEEEEGDESCRRVAECIDPAALALEPLLADIVNDPSFQEQCVGDTGIPPEVLREECR